MNRRHVGSIAAAAAFALLSSGVLSSTAVARDGGVKCAGVNSCKGHSECKTATHDCKGMNSCKGDGWVNKASEQECIAAGGTVQK